MTQAGWGWLAVALLGATAVLSFATYGPDAVRAAGNAALQAARGAAANRDAFSRDAQSLRLALQRTRHSASDLELGGDLAGVPRARPDSSRWPSCKHCLRRPTPSATTRTSAGQYGFAVLRWRSFRPCSARLGVRR